MAASATGALSYARFDLLRESVLQGNRRAHGGTPAELNHCIDGMMRMHVLLVDVSDDGALEERQTLHRFAGDLEIRDARTLMLNDSLCERIVRESHTRCAEIAQMLQRYSPAVRSSFRPAQSATEVRVAFGFVDDPAGDELAFEVALTSRDFWCEVTMFVGQATRATVGSSCWEQEEPKEYELTAWIAGAFGLLTPRANHIFQNRARPQSD